MFTQRKSWLDWERGLAVLLMVEVHVLDAWLAPPEARGALRAALTMAGGFAAPLFLFLSGLSQVFSDARAERQGALASARRWSSLRRALSLLAVAYGFRVTEFVLGRAYRIPGGWRDVFRVDILNVIAIALVIACLLGVGMPRRVHIFLASCGVALFCGAAPVVAGWHHAPNRFLDYLFATYPRANFSLFNWAGFLLAGSVVGRVFSDRERPGLLMLMGAAAFGVGWWSDSLPPLYAHQDFWITSPSWFAMRLGVVLAITGGLQLVPVTAAQGLGWLSTLGRHSLIGYLASIELTYGHPSKVLHGALSLPAVIASMVAMSAVTWAIAWGAEYRVQLKRRRAAPPASAIALGLGDS